MNNCGTKKTIPKLNNVAIKNFSLKTLFQRVLNTIQNSLARDLARIGRGAALRSYWAHVAVPLRGAVQQRASVVHTVPLVLSSFPFGQM